MFISTTGTVLNSAVSDLSSGTWHTLGHHTTRTRCSYLPRALCQTALCQTCHHVHDTHTDIIQPEHNVHIYHGHCVEQCCVRLVIRYMTHRGTSSNQNTTFISTTGTVSNSAVLDLSSGTWHTLGHHHATRTQHSYLPPALCGIVLRQTCHQWVTRSILAVYTLEPLSANVLRTVTLCSWAGNRRSGVAMAMCIPTKRLNSYEMEMSFWHSVL